MTNMVTIVFTLKIILRGALLQVLFVRRSENLMIVQN